MPEPTSDDSSKTSSESRTNRIIDPESQNQPPETVAGYIGGGWATTFGSDTRELSLPSIPGYTVLREIGRGASAVVFEATDERLNRHVAIKMLYAAGLVSAAQLHRFKTEAQTVAKLSHPNIVQIFEVGEHAGIPFFVMELLEHESQQTMAGKWQNNSPLSYLPRVLQ